jgi:hypothetical protein
VRTFSLRYWMAGLGERSGPVGALSTALQRRLPRALSLSLSLGRRAGHARAQALTGDAVAERRRARVPGAGGHELSTDVEGRTLGRRVAVNTAAQVAGRVIILGLAAVSIAIVTRYLGPTLYGRYALALAYIGLFGVLADVGLFTIVVREISKRRRTRAASSATRSRCARSCRSWW